MSGFSHAGELWGPAIKGINLEQRRMTLSHAGLREAAFFVRATGMRNGVVLVGRKRES